MPSRSQLYSKSQSYKIKQKPVNGFGWNKVVCFEWDLRPNNNTLEPLISDDRVTDIQPVSNKVCLLNVVTLNTDIAFNLRFFSPERYNSIYVLGSAFILLSTVH